jgi:hypothetical protein
MSDFAKLFGSGEDQIVVMIQSDDEGDPEVRLFYQPKDLGVCSLAIGFPDTDDGWDHAEKAFAKMDEKRVRGMVSKAMKELGLSDEPKEGV